MLLNIILMQIRRIIMTREVEKDRESEVQE